MGRTAFGSLATIGYLLSPLSWWNDLFVNLPIAYGIGSLLGLVSSSLFLSGVIAGYLLTNVVGLVLLHRGATALLKRDGTLA